MHRDFEEPRFFPLKWLLEFRGHTGHFSEDRTLALQHTETVFEAQSTGMRESC